MLWGTTEPNKRQTGRRSDRAHHVCVSTHTFHVGARGSIGQDALHLCWYNSLHRDESNTMQWVAGKPVCSAPSRPPRDEPVADRTGRTTFVLAHTRFAWGRGVAKCNGWPASQFAARQVAHLRLQRVHRDDTVGLGGRERKRKEEKGRAMTHGWRWVRCRLLISVYDAPSCERTYTDTLTESTNLYTHPGPGLRCRLRTYHGRRC